jgi:hypothetical protein
MDEVAIEVVHKLPAWYLELMLPVLAAAGIWVFSRLKRDKQGKLYWFSRAYEDRKNNKKLDEIMAKTDEVSKRTSRLELLDLISHRPNAKDIILPKYDEYKKKGYNSYIDIIVEKWKSEIFHLKKEAV